MLDRRAKAKAKTGPSPKKNIDTLPKVPPFPTGEKPSGSQDKPKNNNLESEHESKGKRSRPRNNQGPKPNTQWPPPVKKDRINKEKPNTNPTSNPKHDTDVNNDNNGFKFWEDLNPTIIKTNEINEDSENTKILMEVEWINHTI